MTSPRSSLVDLLAARLLPAILLVPVLVGCPHYRSPGDRLRMAVMEYNDGIRWQRWKEAARFLPPDKRDEFLERKEAEAGSFRVTEFEVHDVRHEQQDDAADVIVEFTWHRYPSLTVHRTRVRQHWVFRRSEWILLSQEEVKPPEPSDDPEDMF